MKTNALTYIGFIIVGLGWMLLIATMTISDSMLRAGNLVAVLALRSDIVTIAQGAIVSGFGFAIVGVLRSGFGAFSRFFEAVLHRSTGARPVPAAPPRDEPRDAFTVASPTERPRTAPMPMPVKEPPLPKERNYVILADGSVEVETMFGTRLFATLDEARDFIR